MNLWLELKDLNAPYYIVLALGIGLFGFLAVIAERRQKSINTAKRHHPASRARQERHR